MAWDPRHGKGLYQQSQRRMQIALTCTSLLRIATISVLWRTFSTPRINHEQVQGFTQPAASTPGGRRLRTRCYTVAAAGGPDGHFQGTHQAVDRLLVLQCGRREVEPRQDLR